MQQAIFIMGPTAVGKTAIAIELAQHFPVDIISVDSAMVYRGLDIGSGKPTADELTRAPHQLIDILDPVQVYSVAQFCSDATKAMQISWERKRIPLLVGGTMLYFRALQFGLADLPSADLDIRNEIMQQANQFGWSAVHERLATLDPATAQRLSVNDVQRVQRALEINLLTGKSLNEIFSQQNIIKLPYKLHSYAIMPSSRVDLHDRIAKRFMQMLDAGLVAEVEALHARDDLNVELPAIRSVGYRQVWSYLEGATDYETMCAQAIAATRQLAKRQLTWLRKWPSALHVSETSDLLLDTIIKSMLDSSNN